MADKNSVKDQKAARRRARVRGKVFGTPDRPRLTVTKSLKNVFAQIVDDEGGRTLIGLSSNSTDVRDKLAKAKKTEAARVVGLQLAALAKEKGIQAVVFDRNANRYHGRIKALAEGAREGGLQF